MKNQLENEKKSNRTTGLRDFKNHNAELGTKSLIIKSLKEDLERLLSEYQSLESEYHALQSAVKK
jgi:hypothetical protein